MPRPFDLLWERLLSGGVRRRYARRYLAELKDHLDDLTAEEQQAGGPLEEARKRAVVRLGGAEVLAEAMIAQRGLRDWSRRLPLITYMIAPSLVLVIGMALAVAPVVTACTGFRISEGTQSDLPLWFEPLVTGTVFFSNAMISVLLGWTLAALAIRQRSRAAWPILGIVMLASMGAVLQVAVTLPSTARHGEITLMQGFGPSFFRNAKYIQRLVLNLALTLPPYLVVSRWRALRLHRRNEEGWHGSQAWYLEPGISRGGDRPGNGGRH